MAMKRLAFNATMLNHPARNLVRPGPPEEADPGWCSLFGSPRKYQIDDLGSCIRQMKAFWMAVL